MRNGSLFYENSVSLDIVGLEMLAEYFGIYVTDVDIWNEARYSENPPHLGNVYQSILFSRLEARMNETYPALQTDYHINDIVSCFYINQQRLRSFNDFFEIIEEKKSSWFFIYPRGKADFPLEDVPSSVFLGARVMNIPVNVNPFERGYQCFRIERLAMIYTRDLPECLHYAPLHPSQEYLKDVEFEGQDAIFSNTHVLVDTGLVAEALREACKYHGHLIKMVYRMTASHDMSETIIGEVSTLEQARRIVWNIQSETGAYHRLWEISNRHVHKDVLDLLRNKARQLSKNWIDSYFLMDLFILDNPGDEPELDLGIRLNHLPWTQEHVMKVTDYDLDGLRDGYLHDGLPASFVDLVLQAGRAGVRILVFSEQGKVLEGLPTFSHG